MKKIITSSLVSALLLSGAASIAVPNNAQAVENITLTSATAKTFNNGKLMDAKKLNNELVKLINKDRKAKKIAPLKVNTSTAIVKGTNLRAVEAGNYFAHNRPNGTSYKTAFSSSVRNNIKGENVMMKSYNPTTDSLTDEKYLASVMFNQWKKSKDHYGNMMNPTFKKSAVAVKVKFNNEKQRYYYYGALVFTTK